MGTSHLRHAEPQYFCVVYTKTCDPETTPKDEPWMVSVAIPSGEDADRKACDLRCAGHKAIVKRVDEVLEHGPPVGWDVQSAVFLPRSEDLPPEVEEPCDPEEVEICPCCGAYKLVDEEGCWNCEDLYLRLI